MSRATRDDVLDTIIDALTAEYGGGQSAAAKAVLRALEDEGVDRDGWTDDRSDR